MQSKITPVSDSHGELDIRGLCRALWYGKKWIAGLAFLFAITALLFSYLMPQRWSTTAVVDKPAIHRLGNYYAQQQLLQYFDENTERIVVGDSVSIADKIADAIYSEFINQLSAWDTCRDFWLMSDYYKQRQKGDAMADAALLDELIRNIQFTPHDNKKMRHDMIKLTADTAIDARQLLRQYVEFASQRSAKSLNDAMRVAWEARIRVIKERVKRKAVDAVTWETYNRALNAVEEALKSAALKEKLASDDTFQTYRYLRTPEIPVMRDSHRPDFLLILWGSLGALVGTGIALVRRAKR